MITRIIRQNALPVTSEVKEEIKKAGGIDSWHKKHAAVKMVNSTTIQNNIKKIGPNDRCPCGSGKKYKKCCRI